MFESYITSQGHRRPTGCRLLITPLIAVSTRLRAGQQKTSILSRDRRPVLGFTLRRFPWLPDAFSKAVKWSEPSRDYSPSFRPVAGFKP